MEIGLVNMNPTKKIPETFLRTLHSLSCRVHWIHCNDYSKEEIRDIIESSQIRKWIFTGSPANVYDVKSPQVSLDLLNLANKELFLICYSMESILHQLGIPVIKRTVNKKEFFTLDTIPTKVCSSSLQGLSKRGTFMRNHHYYTPSEATQGIQGITLLASHENEAMILSYKNSILTQFHPEKSDDGKQILFNWIYGNNLPWNNLYGIHPIYNTKV